MPGYIQIGELQVEKWGELKKLSKEWTAKLS